jgi:hypothetical protein
MAIINAFLKKKKTNRSVEVVSVPLKDRLWACGMLPSKQGISNRKIHMLPGIRASIIKI